MANCENNCTFCNGDYCEFSRAECSVCGEVHQTGEMWVVNGKYVCSRCYLEAVKNGKRNLETRDRL